jgi:hypothetical protein
MSEPVTNGWITNVVIEFGATFCGVIFALAADHWNSNRIAQNRVNEIIPYIYMELSENLRLTQGNRGPFFIHYWRAHEEDLIKWKEKEMLLRIIRMYNLMRARQSPELLTVDERTHYGHFLIEIVRWFDDKADSDPGFKARLESTKKHYFDMSESLRKGDPSAYRRFKPKYFD